MPEFVDAGFAFDMELTPRWIKEAIVI